MTTFIEQANAKAVTEMMGDSEYMSTLALYVHNLRKGLFCSEHVALITQKWDRYPFDIYDALPFSMVWSDLCLAKVVCARVYVGSGPASDKYASVNNAILSKLVYPFCGEFWGGTQDEDGYIEVNKEIEFDMRNLETGERVTRMVSGCFPLEVGYISAAKTMHYLRVNGRLARWPYGSKDIWLLYRVDQDFLELKTS